MPRPSASPKRSMPDRPRKELGLSNVYAISTGAMFGSGFFLLPGLAAAQTGPSAPLAYLAAAVFALPALLSVAELATALPRAGGAYYFLDRSLGPLVGILGGMGSWLALVLKSAFALVGMGAYLAIYLDVPIEPMAVVFTLLFMGINIVGTWEGSGMQRALVAALLVLLGLFIVVGLLTVLNAGVVSVTRDRFTPLLPSGVVGFMSTVGLVFVCYAGLTTVAGASEEIRDPERNIPLGMGLSLATAAGVYSLGVYVMVAVVPPAVLRTDLTPVATAASTVLDWLPGGLGVALIVVAAMVAFASTGNAGVLAASRYPLAMARDQLVPRSLATLSGFGTPTRAIIATSLLMVLAIALPDVSTLAKLASASQLLLFSLLNLAVVIMRESQIPGYDPGFRSPFYPWTQVVGLIAPLWLISEMGSVAIVFTLVLGALTILWYFGYARPRIARSGAILHTFARWGRRRYPGLDLELRSIVREKGLRLEDPFDEVVARALVLDHRQPVGFDRLVEEASLRLGGRAGLPAYVLETGFLASLHAGLVPVGHGCALPHVRVPGIERPVMLLGRCRQGVLPTALLGRRTRSELAGVRAVVFLVSAEEEATQHLRMLGHLATHVEDPDFLDRWLEASDEASLKATLLRPERWITVRLGDPPATAEWVGLRVRQLSLPPACLVALVLRNGRSIVPGGDTVLRADDQLIIVGEAHVIRAVTARWRLRASDE